MILGIQIGITSGAAFYKDGDILFASSEERYSNIKNDTDFPRKAILDGMKTLGITGDQIEKVVMVSRYMSPVHFLIRRECSFSVEDYLREQEEYYYPRFFKGEKPDYLEIFKDKIDPSFHPDLLEKARNLKNQSDLIKCWNDWRIQQVLDLVKVSPESIVIMGHEHAHAAYGYYGSPFRGEDTLIVTFDGFGDDSNATIAEIEGGKIKFLQKYNNFNVGRIYRYITLLLKMKPSEHEYKVMGLGPYASDYVMKGPLEVFRKAYRLSEDGKVVGDPDLKDHYYYFRERFESYRFDGIAGALQKFTEEMTCSLVDYWMKKTGKTRVVLSGGVSLNIKANMEIGKLDSVKDIFVCGSGGDESLSMGALFAYLDEAGRGGEIKSLPCLYLGGAIDQKESEAALAEVPNLADYEVVRDPTPQDVARHLADGKIIARMQDRMEFGARALGNRSILADPRSSKTIKKINYQIKKRDFWMPFTPSMLKEEEDAFLSNPKGFQYPYMSVACETTDKGKASLSAALHPADETARPQLVEEHINPGYHALLKAFKEITGVGALLNTSLNLHGYPIARTAREGLFVFLNSKLDGLWFSNILILRK